MLYIISINGTLCSYLNTGEEDFSASPVNILFEAGGITNITVQLTLVDDDINEIEQAFVAFLELQDAINPALVNISDARFATYCRIIDNDRKLHKSASNVLLI